MIDISGKKILLVRNDNIGDLICTTPAIEALRRKYPAARIDIVVNSYNYDAIHKNPFIDKIYCYTKTGHAKSIKSKVFALYGKKKIISDIKREKYDAVVVFRSGYSKYAELFSRITSAKYKVGVKSLDNIDDFNVHLPPNHTINEVLFCFECLKPFGVEYGGEKTRFFIDPAMVEKYKTFNNVFVFHISAREKKNKMSFEKLRDIINMLDMDMFITAEPDDFEIARKLERDTKAAFIQTSSFLDLGAFLTRAKLLLTLEGGAMHLAAAIGVKTMALFGKSLIDRWYPWGYKDLVLQDKSMLAENIDNKNIVQAVQKELSKNIQE